MKESKYKTIGLLYLTIFLINKSCAIYTEETPVKLLEVAPVADRYPASESPYRVSITDGYVRNDFGHSFTSEIID